jgi:hypothetical protein
MDKNSYSRKTKEHKSRDIRSESRSDNRQHHHLPKNSTRRVRSISSSSPIMKHKKKYGVDELQGEMSKIKPPTFDGEHNKDGILVYSKSEEEHEQQLEDGAMSIEGASTICQDE